MSYLLHFLWALYIIDILKNDVNLQFYYCLYKKKKEIKQEGEKERKKDTLFFSFSIVVYPTQYYDSLSASGRGEKNRKEKENFGEDTWVPNRDKYTQKWEVRRGRKEIEIYREEVKLTHKILLGITNCENIN